MVRWLRRRPQSTGRAKQNQIAKRESMLPQRPNHISKLTPRTGTLCFFMSFIQSIVGIFMRECLDSRYFYSVDQLFLVFRSLGYSLSWSKFRSYTTITFCVCEASSAVSLLEFIACLLWFWPRVALCRDYKLSIWPKKLIFPLVIQLSFLGVIGASVYSIYRIFGSDESTTSLQLAKAFEFVSCLMYLFLFVVTFWLYWRPDLSDQLPPPQPTRFGLQPIQEDVELQVAQNIRTLLEVEPLFCHYHRRDWQWCKEIHTTIYCCERSYQRCCYYQELSRRIEDGADRYSCPCGNDLVLARCPGLSDFLRERLKDLRKERSRVVKKDAYSTEALEMNLAMGRLEEAIKSFKT